MALMTGLFDWRVLTGTLNEVKNPNRFLQDLLFFRRNTNAGDVIETHVRKGGRQMTPFVRKGSAAQLIKGRGYDIRQVTPPTIRLKMSFEPHKYLADPGPGVIAATTQGNQGVIAEAARRRIAQDIEVFDDYITNTIEWLCGQALTGQIVYSATLGAGEETDIFQVTFPRDAANTITNAGGENWGSDDFEPAKLIRAGKVQLNEAVGQTATHLIMADDVGEAFVNNTKVKANLDIRRLQQAGPIVLGGGRIIEGAVYEGTYAGVECWTYSRKVDILGPDLAVAAADQPIIPASKAFLVSVPSAGQSFGIEFGGIHDWETLQNGSLAQERFMKAWTENDPSAGWQLMETRPLPVTKLVDSVVELRPLA